MEQKIRMNISEIPPEVYLKPNKVLLKEKPKKGTKRINLLSIPKKANSTCINADVLTKKTVIPKLSKEIDYLIDVLNSEHVESNNEFRLEPIRNITHNDYYYKKYNLAYLNLLMDNVLKNQQYKKTDIFVKDFENKKHQIKEKKKKLNKDEKLYHEILKQGNDRKVQNIFENFLELKTLEEKYNTVLKKSMNEIDELNLFK